MTSTYYQYRARLDVSRMATMTEDEHVTAGPFDLRLVDEDRAVDTADRDLPATGIGGHPAYVCRIAPRTELDEGGSLVVVGWRLTTRGRARGGTRHHDHATAAAAIAHAEAWARRRFAYPHAAAVDEARARMLA
jgi:hypothetical protein